MHIPAKHAETDHSTLRAFIRENPLGLLITSLPSTTPNHPTIQCTHIPWVIDDPSSSSDANNQGILRAHLARANPQVKALAETIAANAESPELEVSIMFTSSTHSYIPPRFYTETKPTTGKVVPTWNYAAAQAWGKIKLFNHGGAADEAEQTDSFLTTQTARLSDEQEESWENRTGGQGKPRWKVSDAPEGYVKVLKKAIVGVEVEITRLEGKWKMSQEMSKGDRQGVEEGFKGLGTEEGTKLGSLVGERAEKMEREKAAAA